MKQKIKSLIGAPLVFALLLLVPPVSSNYATRVWTIGLINLIMGVSLSMSISVAGVVSMGQAGFYAIGAYAAAVLATSSGLAFPFTLIVGGILAALAGVLVAVPSLRLRGMYFMLTTMAFGEVVRLVALNWTSVTRGPIGITGIPGVIPGADLSPGGYYAVALSLAALTYFACEYISSSDYGLLCKGMRDDDTAASVCGMNVPVLRISAAAIACFFSGMAGGFYAHMYSFVSPEPFNGGLSLSLLVISMLGSLIGPMLSKKPSYAGTAVSAILLTWLLEALRFMKEYRMAFYGLIMMVLVVGGPQLQSLIRSLTRQVARREVKSHAS